MDLITLQQLKVDASTLVRTRKPACLARRLYGLGEGLVMCSNLGRKRRDRRRRLSLPQTKSGHIGGAVRQGLGGRLY
ncbi:MAG TPA: hypothetical protein VEM60_08320, partial [Candidatus Dormibacteraeota bacterium]|nr:hypothetical protein [Candidatus Dormibacteraeota bacterium]